MPNAAANASTGTGDPADPHDRHAGHAATVHRGDANPSPIDQVSLGGLVVTRLRRPAGEHVVEHDLPALALSLLPLPGSEVTLRGSCGIKSVETQCGTHCLMSAGTRVEGRWRSATDYLIARFEPLALPNLIGEAVEFRTAFANRSSDDPSVLTLGSLIVQELESGNPRGQLYLESLTTALALAVFPRAEHECRDAGPDPRLRRALDYLHANLAENLSIDDLAAQACLSRFHFMRLFRHELRRSPYQYILEQRLDLARSLLTRSALPVSEVAERSGFKSAAHFTRLFARENGMPPTAYRQRIRAR